MQRVLNSASDSGIFRVCLENVRRDTQILVSERCPKNYGHLVIFKSPRWVRRCPICLDTQRFPKFDCDIRLAGKPLRVEMWVTSKREKRALPSWDGLGEPSHITLWQCMARSWCPSSSTRAARECGPCFEVESLVWMCCFDQHLRIENV